MEDVKINKSEYKLEKGGTAKLAVLIYVGDSDPRPILDAAVESYTNGKSYHELIDANLDNPWMRVVLEDINDLPQTMFNPETDHL